MALLLALLWRACWLKLHLDAELKVSFLLCRVANTKSGAVNAGALIPPSGYAERQQWIIYPLCSKQSHFPDAQKQQKTCGRHINGITGVLSGVRQD